MRSTAALLLALQGVASLRMQLYFATHCKLTNVRINAFWNNVIFAGLMGHNMSYYGIRGALDLSIDVAGGGGFVAANTSCEKDEWTVSDHGPDACTTDHYLMCAQHVGQPDWFVYAHWCALPYLPTPLASARNDTPTRIHV